MIEKIINIDSKTMKISSSFLIYTFISIILISCNAQDSNDYFCGSISYSNKLEPKSNLFNKEQLKDMFGLTATFTYKDGSYIQTYSGGGLEFDYLDSKNKKYYMKNYGNDTILVFDASHENENELISLTEIKVSENIMDFECKGIEIKMRNRLYGIEISTTLIYSDKIIINPENFKNIKKMYMDKSYRKIRSLPLKIVLENSHFKMTSTANNIDSENCLSPKEVFESKTKGLIFKQMN